MRIEKESFTVEDAKVKSGSTKKPKHKFPPVGSEWKTPKGKTRKVVWSGFVKNALGRRFPVVDYKINVFTNTYTQLLSDWNQWTKKAERVDKGVQG